MKGISYVVASILMLVITIALSGTAYMYMSGVFTATIQGIEVADAYCSLGEVSLSIKNIGSTTIGALEIEQTNPRVDDILARAFQGAIDPGKAVRYTDTCEGEEARRCIYRITPPVGKTIVADVICTGRPESLVLALHFDEGSGDTAYDSSGNNNDGTLGPNLNQLNDADSLTGWTARAGYSYIDVTLDNDRVEGSGSIKLFDVDGVPTSGLYSHIQYDLPSDEDWSSQEFLTFYIKVIDKPSFVQYFAFLVETKDSSGFECAWADCVLTWLITDQITNNEWSKIFIDLNNPDSQSSPDITKVWRLHIYARLADPPQPLISADYLVDDIWLGNSPIWTGGKYGSALSFDGVDDYVDAGDDVSLDMTTNDFTISAWVNIPSTDSCNNDPTNPCTIVGKGAHGDIGYKLQVTSTENLMLTIQDATDFNYITDTTALPVNSWNHVAAIIMRSTDQVKFYINGQLSSTQDLALSGSISNPSRVMHIGSADTSGYRYFNGTIGEIGIYNKALA